MAKEDIALMAHLMRRAGFGAQLEELEARAAKGYEATVEELLHPLEQPDLEHDVIKRYRTDWMIQAGLEQQQEEWTYEMINTNRPLLEKMTLFWHGIFPTGHAKLEFPRQQYTELNMYRELGMGSFRDVAPGPGQRPGHGVLPGQLHEPQRGHQRELGQRTPGVVLPGRGHGRRIQLLRGRRQRGGPRLHRLDGGQRRTQISLTAGTSPGSSTTPPTMTTETRPSWERRATSTARTSSTSS